MVDSLYPAFPVCSEELHKADDDVISELGRRWRDNESRPKPSLETLEKWDKTISDWIDSGLPLLIRKNNERGSTIRHISGREIVFVDNSPAQAIFILAVGGQTPDPAAIVQYMRDGAFPMAMIWKGGERERATYKGGAGSQNSTAAKGWKLAHITAVKLGRTNFETASLDVLETHFRKFLSPRNMFVVPKMYAGIAEVPAFLKAFQ